MRAASAGSAPAHRSCYLSTLKAQQTHMHMGHKPGTTAAQMRSFPASVCLQRLSVSPIRADQHSPERHP